MEKAIIVQSNSVHAAWSAWRWFRLAVNVSEAGANLTDVDKRDAERYRWLKEKRNVLLLTGFFGNGCINRKLEEVDAVIDAEILKAANVEFSGGAPLHGAASAGTHG